MERANNRKWLAAVASIWIQCSCGASYAFGIYSPILKSSQGYDQSTLDMVSVFKDIGANAGILSGFLYSAVAVLRHRHPSSSSSSSSGITGPWVVHLVGAIQCFLGYFFMWLSVTGIIHKPHVYLMCLFMFLAAHSQTFFNTANVVTAVHNFPGHSGTIVGIMKGYLGLSGAVLIQVYLALFEGSPSTFLLILALLPTLLSVFLMFLVRIEATYTSDDKRHLNSFSAIALLLAAYLMILILLENVITLPFQSRLITFSMLLVLLSSPIIVAKRAQKSDSSGLADALSTVTTPLIDDQESKLSQATSSADSDVVTTNLIQKSNSCQDMEKKFGEEMNLWEAMRTVNFWLLFIAMLCGMGSGLATVNNISQIGESLGYTAVERSALVSLWSIWNFLGRFGAGYASDIFLQRKGWARPLFMTLTLAAMTGGHVIIASGFPGNLYVGSVLVGVCYGSQWSLMPTITSEIFGMKHMGTIFNTIAIASPVGSYVWSVRIIGYIYDKNASQGNVCYGKNCFMLSFSILASVSLSGFFIALVLFFRTRKFYSQVLGSLKHRNICLFGDLDEILSWNFMDSSSDQRWSLGNY